MSYGFQINNDKGSIVVDDQHVTLSVVARGTMHYAEGLFYNSNRGFYVYNDYYYGMLIRAYFPSVINSIEPPLVVMIPDSPQGAVHSYQPIGSPGAWSGFEIAYKHVFDLPYGGQYQGIPHIGWKYAVVRMDMVIPSNERWGLRVFNEEGKLTFDSGTKILRLREHLKGWQATGGSYGWREYALPWNYGFDGEHGLLVSNLTGFQVYQGNFNLAWGSVRFGFSQHGTIRAAVGGLVKLDVDRIATHGGIATDKIGRLLEQQTGGPQVFAVQVM